MSAPSGGAAFPLLDAHANGRLFLAECGMTLRQYAAIHLRVPNSGTDWLDDMIRESQRNEIAAKAMQGMLSWDHEYRHDVICRYSYQVADAMAAGESKP